MEDLEIIIVSLFGGAWLLLVAAVLVLCCQVASLRRRVTDLAAAPRMRVQRVTMESERERHHAFNNPALSPDEELSKRGYSMYVADDVEGRGTERQTGGQFVEELSRELESRQQRQMAPPFLLQGIQENKIKSRDRNHDNPAGNHGNAASNHGNPAGNHGNAAGNHGNAAGNHGNHVGNQSNHVGNQSNLHRNYSNPAANQQSNYSNHKTRQSDTNPNFIY